jgi:hypothetical protein
MKIPRKNHRIRILGRHEKLNFARANLGFVYAHLGNVTLFELHSVLLERREVSATVV